MSIRDSKGGNYGNVVHRDGTVPRIVEIPGTEQAVDNGGSWPYGGWQKYGSQAVCINPDEYEQYNRVLGSHTGGWTH
jgi:hypothetical protein